MRPPFLIPDIKNLTEREINETIARINRALEDLYRGTLYASKGQAQIAVAQLAPDVITTINNVTSGVTYTVSGSVTSGLAAISGVIASGMKDISLIKDPTFNDVTGSRSKNTVYQNTDTAIRVCQISVTLTG